MSLCRLKPKQGWIDTICGGLVRPRPIIRLVQLCSSLASRTRITKLEWKRCRCRNRTKQVCVRSRASLRGAPLLFNFVEQRTGNATVGKKAQTCNDEVAERARGSPSLSLFSSGERNLRIVAPTIAALNNHERCGERETQGFGRTVPTTRVRRPRSGQMFQGTQRGTV